MAELDLHSPGFAGHFLRASDERRQTIASYLAALHTRQQACRVPDNSTGKQYVAHFLASASHSDILATTYGDVPIGLRGALGRAGPQPHEPRFYSLLVHLLRGQRRPAVARAIQHLKKVDLTTLEIACVLPRELLSPDLVCRIRDRFEARSVAVVVELLRSRVIDPEAFSAGLRALRRRGELEEFFGKWVLRCEFAPSPVPASDAYMPISNGPTLARKALEYRNCSRTYAVDLLQGSASLAEFVSDRGSAIVLLMMVKGDWWLEDVFGARNRAVDPTVRAHAVELLRRHGIRERCTPARKTTPYGALRRFLPRGVWL